MQLGVVCKVSSHSYTTMGVVDVVVYVGQTERSVSDIPRPTFMLR